jgi:5-methylcytosine-specific restriction protein A
MNYEGLKRIEKAYDFNNLMSICKNCHQRIHNKNDGDGFE